MRLPQSARSARLPGVAAVAVLIAAAELFAGAAAGLATGYPRAEALIFAGPRPWALLALALIVAGLGRWRFAALATFLAIASLAETFYLLRLGNPQAWIELLRPALAGAALALVLSLVLAVARRGLGRAGLVAAGAACALIFASPAFREGWRAFAVPAAAAAAPAGKPDLLLMTALPIVWGEGGAFDPSSRPAGAYRLLQEEFAVRPVDTLDAGTLRGARLLLLAQPRWLAPAELVDLDAWVRDGGRALILTDPLLEWPSELPLGDIRRPPPVGLLAPLLDHWGLAFDGRRADGGGVEAGRRLVLRHAGRLTATRPSCRVLREYLAECRIGRGGATIIADADLMRDDLWMAPGAGGDLRDRRIADNPLVLADRLDALAGIRRERTRPAVRWARPEARPLEALRLVSGALLLLAGLLGAAALLLRRRTR